MTEERDVSLEEEEMTTVKLGSREFEIPKTFFARDLKSLAKLADERRLVLIRGDEERILKDDDKVDVEDGDYFKDIPPLRKGCHEPK